MPNKAMYEGCVDLYYGIEPLSYFEMGKYVTGSQGCYHGPEKYRAPGYLEGIEGWGLQWRRNYRVQSFGFDNTKSNIQWWNNESN